MDIATLIATYQPGDQFTIADNDYDNLVMHTGSKPRLATLEAWGVDYQSKQVERDRDSALNDLKVVADQAYKAITSRYAEMESKTWSKKEIQAHAWLADESTSTPFLDSSLAQNPGITKLDLCNRIVSKALEFEEVAGNIDGQIDRLRSNIENSDDPAAIIIEITINAAG